MLQAQRNENATLATESLQTLFHPGPLQDSAAQI